MTAELSSSRMIRLHCPTLSKTVPLEAREEQKLDLGSIARAFGLEPSSVRLNGHFISRGIDLISSSVTWRSLLRFFSSKGLSTGKDGGAPLIVDGKLLKVGNKRTQDREGSSANGIGRRHLEEEDIIKLPHSKKLKDQGQGSGYGSLLGFKRKHLLEEVKAELSKKVKINDSPSVLDGRIHTIPSRQQSCGYMSQNTKRQREDDAIAASPVKRVR
ncbi:uncharacterized protein LOC116215260 [Punica granatum]|uniref:Uncharacterized protein LOC116215260 n=1 Tax=Punica granatum TaxID=22663 RepID=A0A6P8E9U5_PUNGR|nr:uncharacterized protein LOC116215260 [Punica granatum]